MRRFLVTWLLAFSLTGLAGYGIGLALGKAEQPPTRAGARVSSVESLESAPQPFTQEDAVQVVASRFASTPRGERYRQELKQAAQVSYHSSQHWTVRWGAASWTAHGPGFYAEPDNDAARQREAEAAAGR